MFRCSGRGDRLALFKLVPGEASCFRWRQTFFLDLRQKLLLARLEFLAEAIHVQARLACLGKKSLAWFFLFLDVVLDLLAQRGHFRVEEFVLGLLPSSSAIST